MAVAPLDGGCFPQLVPPKFGNRRHTGSPCLVKVIHIALAV
jgi:hypothetical protein